MWGLKKGIGESCDGCEIRYFCIKVIDNANDNNKIIDTFEKNFGKQCAKEFVFLNKILERNRGRRF